MGSVDHHREHQGSIGSRGLVGSVDQPFVGSDGPGGQLTGYRAWGLSSERWAQPGGPYQVRDGPSV